MLNRILKRVKFLLVDGIYLLRATIKILFSAKKVMALMGTPEYHNIGDIAIMEGEKQFIGNYFAKYTLIEVTLEIYNRNTIIVNYVLSKCDVIFITGGGFLGNLWRESSGMVKSILQKYKNKKVVIFPQTIFYSENSSDEVIEEDKLLFENHPNLFVTLREAISYRYFNDHIKCTGNSRIFLAPDMALYLKYDSSTNKNGVLMCMRKDKERTINDSENNKVVKALIENNYKNVKYTDTAYDGLVARKERLNLLNEKIDEIAGAELIITDRLHGMVLAAITGTKCIAITSKSHKIIGVYEWLSDIVSVYVVENNNSIPECIKNINSDQNNSNQVMLYSKEYAELANQIKSFICERK